RTASRPARRSPVSGLLKGMGPAWPAGRDSGRGRAWSSPVGGTRSRPAVERNDERRPAAAARSVRGAPLPLGRAPVGKGDDALVQRKDDSCDIHKVMARGGGVNGRDVQIVLPKGGPRGGELAPVGCFPGRVHG